MTRLAMAAPAPAGRSPLGLGLAYGAFAALGLIWGINFIFVKWAAAAISPAQIVLLRVLFGFLPLLVVALVTGALRWRDWRHAHHFLVMSCWRRPSTTSPSPRVSCCSCRASRAC
jgi:hypothetical protein